MAAVREKEFTQSPLYFLPDSIYVHVTTSSESPFSRFQPIIISAWYIEETAEREKSWLSGSGRKLTLSSMVLWGFFP